MSHVRRRNPQEKIRLIREAGCTHFIDDLEKNLLEKDFPPHVTKILFGHHSAPAHLHSAQALADWSQVSTYVFNAAK